MRFRDLAIRNTVSPYGLAMLSYAFFLLACSIPPSIYSRYMHEPDLMFLDPATILFYTLCVAAFVAGVGLVEWLYPSTPLVARRLDTKISPVVFLLAPLLAGIALTALSVLLLVERNPGIVLVLLSQQAQNLKDFGAIDTEGTMATAPTMFVAIVCWAFWRSSELGLHGWRRWLVNCAICVAVLTVIVAATLTVSRSLLMLAVSGLAILFIARRIAAKKVSVKFILGAGASIGAGVVMLFFTFSVLRGTSSWDHLVYELIGYTAASYNRLAALLGGRLRYPFGGRYLYLSSFVAYSQALNRIVPLSTIMNWPGYMEVWSSEFGAMDRAGLDGGAIWAGAFGYIFSDLGWFAVPFVFGYGLLYGVVWNWIKRGRVLGIVLYPCFGFCILFWIGSNFLLDSQPVFLFVAALLLAGYEFVLVRKSATQTAPS